MFSMQSGNPWDPGFTEVGWKVPEVLGQADADVAVDHLRTYVAQQDGKGPEFFGSYFEKLGGGGDRATVRNVVTAKDLVSLQLLSVRVSGQVALSLLTTPIDVTYPMTCRITRNRFPGS